MPNNKLILRTLNSPYIGNAGDITKGNVLTHNELDENFIFLKGEDILSATTNSTILTLHKVNTSTVNVDLASMIAGADTFTTGTTLVGSTLYFNRTDAYSAYTADLSPLLDDTNFYTTGGTLVGQTIVYDRNDTLSAYTIDVSGLVPDVDYGNVIFVSEVGPSGDTRADIIGNPLKPVGLGWASQIAQSGDTIHVEAGIYTVTTTGATGLSVSGVNHYFKQGAKVYKSTSGPMFSKTDGAITLNETNVYGAGSFYGSGSCGYIFYNFGFENSNYIQVYEWDICENSSNDCYSSIFNGNTILRGKRRIISSAGIAIRNASTDSNATLVVECPKIKSTTSVALLHDGFAGGVGNLTVNSSEIVGATLTLGVQLGYHGTGHSFTINSNYINYVTVNSPSVPIKLTLNVNRIDRINNFSGTYLKVNGHLGWLSGSFSGIADIALIDRCWAGGTGVINTTFNGSFNYASDSSGSNLVSSIAGNIICNYRLQKPNPTAGPYQYSFIDGWFFSNAGNTVNLLGNWDIQNFWYSHASGRLNIPSGTVINIGPVKSGITFGSIGETFNLNSVDTNIGGTIVERCPQVGPCNTNQSGHTYSNTLFSVNPNNGTQSTGNSRIIYNGATIIVRDQNSQLITTSLTGGTIGIYSAGLNTNKIDAFEAEKEKRRISVTGTSASYTVNGETFTCTTGTTAADCAAELVALTNASMTLSATASQDNPGVNQYFYIESDVAGTPLTLSYGTATALNVIIRYNTKAITDNVGGTLIEDENIIKDLFN